jgi:hypothetical protein
MAGTRWVKIDTSYLRNPKITSVSPAATLLHLASILWTADQLKDGAIPKGALPELAAAARISRAASLKRVAELVDADLWQNNGDGWYLRDFAVMNSQALRAKVEAQRQAWRESKGYSP